MAGFNLTRFNFKSHGFAMFAFEDMVNAYEDEFKSDFSKILSRYVATSC